MLKFLTHKLRTHSLNEESVAEKVEEHDSGTESDDEADREPGDFCTDVIMKWNDVTDLTGESCACTPARPRSPPAPPAAPARRPPPPEPDLLYDHHSSEEELEVINGARAEGAEGEGAAGAARLESRRRAASSPAPAGGKRKWPASPASAASPALPHHDDDDEDAKVETPVRFRTSPPLEALKPRGGRAGAAGGAGGGSAIGGTDSRRRRLALPPRRHRPALDFDKMQQLRVSGASAGVRWRAGGGAHAGELSVFCW